MLMYKYLTSRIPVLFVLFLVIVLSSILPLNFCLIDILSQFRVQYFYTGIVFLLIFIIFSCLQKQFLLYVLFSLVLTGVNLSGIKFSSLPSIESSATVKIGLYNVLTQNGNYEMLLDEVSKNKPNIIILLETDDVWAENIKELKNIYPYFYEHNRDDNFGMSLYSNIPFKTVFVEEWTYSFVPVIRAEFNYENKPVTLYCIHTLPPVNTFYVNTRNEMFAKIRELASVSLQNGENVIFAGDFNSTIYSNAFKTNLGILEDAQSKFGIKSGSWNAWWLYPFRVSLDHFLTTPSINTKHFYLGKYIGSDHLPVYLEY